MSLIIIILLIIPFLIFKNKLIPLTLVLIYFICNCSNIIEGYDDGDDVLKECNADEDCSVNNKCYNGICGICKPGCETNEGGCSLDCFISENSGITITDDTDGKYLISNENGSVDYHINMSNVNLDNGNENENENERKNTELLITNIDFNNNNSEITNCNINKGSGLKEAGVLEYKNSETVDSSTPLQINKFNIESKIDCKDNLLEMSNRHNSNIRDLERDFERVTGTNAANMTEIEDSLDYINFQVNNINSTLSLISNVHDSYYCGRGNCNGHGLTEDDDNADPGVRCIDESGPQVVELYCPKNHKGPNDFMNAIAHVPHVAP